MPDNFTQHILPEKFRPIEEGRIFRNLSSPHRWLIKEKISELFFSFSDIQRLTVIACDLEMWEAGNLSSIWPESIPANYKGKTRRQYVMQCINREYHTLQMSEKTYSDKKTGTDSIPEFETSFTPETSQILGLCPVASEKTRCCNLRTLDAVVNCGFGCSYCTIQPFYSSDNILFHTNLRKKLDRLPIDPQSIYHFGTGQSSDSLMWGNKNGLFDDLFNFAEQHQNVILELKSKARIPRYFHDHKIPFNVISTWTLNPQSVIDNEEPGTAGLDARIAGARTFAEKGNITGFHFHPVIPYKNWKNEYREIAEKLMDSFDPKSVAMVSMGTLTFIKPVLRQIRERKLSTKILQMPMVECAGKYSYPDDIKREMFSAVYEFFSQWHGKVFFYLCMEPAYLWKSVFGYEYTSNEAFEDAMKKNYMNKIRTAKTIREK